MPGSSIALTAKETTLPVKLAWRSRSQSRKRQLDSSPTASTNNTSKKAKSVTSTANRGKSVSKSANNKQKNLIVDNPHHYEWSEQHR